MLTIRDITPTDRDFVKQALKTLWGSDRIVYSTGIFHADNLQGFLAEENGRVVGLLTYIPQNNLLQIISINALTPGKGIGTALIEKTKQLASGKGVRHITVTTTNDNTRALEFYKKKGFGIREIRKGVVAKSREIKPEIPRIGENGIPIEDEIELEMIQL